MTTFQITCPEFRSSLVFAVRDNFETDCYAGNLLEDEQLANQTERRVVGTGTRRFIPKMNVVSTE